MRITTPGASLMAMAAILGVAVSVFNYSSPDSGINGTPGVILVIVSSAILFLFGLILAGTRWKSTGLRGFIMIAALLDIAGTGFAAYLLHSQALVILMVVALVGWVIQLFRRRSVVA